jgi:hypothetical protein
MKLPPPLRRPKFAQWRYDRGLPLRQTAALIVVAGQAIGRPVPCSYEWVRAICLPFSHPDRALPGADLAAAIEHLTEGIVTLEDFSPPVRKLA